LLAKRIAGLLVAVVAVVIVVVVCAVAVIGVGRAEDVAVETALL
jgi:hypothetical protein